MEKLISNSGQSFSVLHRDGRQCLIRFDATGSVRQANSDNISAGKVRDFYAVTVYGHGYYGEFEKVAYWKQAKQLWQNMLKRCYCEADKKGYFGRVEVDVRWKCFANFLNDLPSLANFDKWVDAKDGEEKYQLDKDLMLPGANIYSRFTCCFITERENKADGGRRGGAKSKPYSKMGGRGLTNHV
jgi:hypothetical protein